MSSDPHRSVGFLGVEGAAGEAGLRRDELGRTLEHAEAVGMEVITEVEAEKEAMLDSYRRALEDSRQQLAAQRQATAIAEERVRVLEQALDRQQALLLMERSHLHVALGKLERIGRIKSFGRNDGSERDMDTQAP